LPDANSGFAEIGILGVPWVLLLAAVLILVSVWLVDRKRAGLPTRPSLTFRRASRAVSSERRFWFLVALFAVNVTTFIGVRVVADWQPLVAVEPYRPGVAITDIVPNAVYVESDAIDAFRNGPEFVYGVTPGTPFDFQVTVRNSGPVAVRLLGWPVGEWIDEPDPGAKTDYYPDGLALPVDLGSPSAAPDRSTAFGPVELGPGEEAAIVVRWFAGECADPNGKRHAEPMQPGVTVEYGSTLVPIVYEVIGWRRKAIVELPFGIAVPAKPDCIEGF
jgi:hypothetical protein